MHKRKSPERPLRADERRRTFTDSQGIFWDVREIRNPDYDRRGGFSLIFDSVSAVRRIRKYPPDWMQMSDDDLERLSFGT